MGASSMRRGWRTSADGSASLNSPSSARLFRGDTRLDSDVDLLYVLSPGARLGFDIDRLEDELADLFGRKVDLVSRKSLHRLLRDDVLVEARTLYAA